MFSRVRRIAHFTNTIFPTPYRPSPPGAPCPPLGPNPGPQPSLCRVVRRARETSGGIAADAGRDDGPAERGVNEEGDAAPGSPIFVVAGVWSPGAPRLGRL